MNLGHKIINVFNLNFKIIIQRIELNVCLKQHADTVGTLAKRKKKCNIHITTKFLLFWNYFFSSNSKLRNINYFVFNISKFNAIEIIEGPKGP